MGILLLAKTILKTGQFSVDFGELNGIIEGYESGISPHGDDYYDLGALSSFFLDSIDYNSTIFSGVYRLSNYLAHLLVKFDLRYSKTLKLTRNIPPHVKHAIFLTLDSPF